MNVLNGKFHEGISDTYATAELIKIGTKGHVTIRVTI
jgi:hypothetical protein